MTGTTTVRRVGVIGAGTMGIGVSHLFAASGFPVTLVDVDDAALSRARSRIAGNARLYPLLDARLADVAADDVLSRISLGTDLAALSDVDFVVENVTENVDAKRRVYTELDAIAPEHCVFGVNTSAIPITRIAAFTTRPGRVIGVHVMNPAPLKPMVEVIRGFHTAAETIELTRSLLRATGRDSIVVNDSSGFVTNRIAMIMVNEAILLLQDGVASAHDIDRLFRQCFGHPMGPLRTADLIGLDTILYSLEVLLDEFNDPKFRPAPLLKQLVYAGRLGEKSGHGFFDYQPIAARQEAGGATP